MTVIHAWPVRPQRRVPDEIYGRAYRRDPVEWLARKRRMRAKTKQVAHRARQNQRADAKARKRRGWI